MNCVAGACFSGGVFSWQNRAGIGFGMVLLVVK